MEARSGVCAMISRFSGRHLCGSLDTANEHFDSLRAGRGIRCRDVATLQSELRRKRLLDSEFERQWETRSDDRAVLMLGK